jgi:hypothetical protein
MFETHLLQADQEISLTDKRKEGSARYNMRREPSSEPASVAHARQESR